MTYYTKMIFGIDAELHDKIFIGMKFAENENNRSVFIEFDTGEKYIFDKNDDNLFLIGEILEIPEQATKITIICENNLKQFGWNVENPAITSIEHFESSTITDLTNAFYEFINVREFKHFDVTSKVNCANSMCYGWEKFNGTIPENFCSIFEYLENADYMFYNWKSYNQPLPERFFSNIKNLVYVISMFNNWKSFNQPLPEGFFCNTKKLKSTSYMFSNWESFNQPLPENFCVNTRHLIDATNMFSNWKTFNKPLPRNFFANNINLKYTNKMFSNWNSFNQPLPERFFSNIKNLEDESLMFYGWNSYEHDLPQYFINIINKLKKSNNYVCCGWHSNKQIRNDFWFNDIFIKDYKKEDIQYIKENYKKEIEDLLLVSKLKNDTKIYYIKEKDLSFVISEGIFMFLMDLFVNNKNYNIRNKSLFKIKYTYINKLPRIEYLMIFENFEKKNFIYL